MNVGTGQLYPVPVDAFADGASFFDFFDGSDVIGVTGSDSAIAEASARIRVHNDPTLTHAEARARAMDEIRALNATERNRGRH